MLGRRQSAAGVPVRRRPGRPVCVPDEPLQRQRNGERRYGQGADHQRADGEGGEDHRLRRTYPVGHEPTERHAAQAAGREQGEGPGMGSTDKPGRRYPPGVRGLPA